MLVDGAVRDVDQLRGLGLPIWARWTRVRGATKHIVGALDACVTVGGTAINPGDVVVLDADGAAVVARARAESVLASALERHRREETKRGKLAAGALSWEIDGLRQAAEAEGYPVRGAAAEIRGPGLAASSARAPRCAPESRD
jgi:4-hydroxy-4-methyl-2-oxoglutarate aldolase